MKKLGLILVLSIASNLVISQNLDTFFTEADAFFKSNVKNGKVAYSQIHTNPSALNSLLILAEKVKFTKEDANTYKAFWINAYNLATIKGVIDNYPIESPLDRDGFFDNIKYNLGGTSITLNDIENKMLRAQFNDARVHFVLVCGAQGCPPIIDEAYKPINVEQLLQRQTEKALNNPHFIKVKDGQLELSEIFKWYKEDFVKDGNEIDYINKFRKDKIPSDFKISYYPYDWKINAQ